MLNRKPVYAVYTRFRPRIEEFVSSNETEHTYTINGRRYHKRSDDVSYFSDEAEARAYLRKQCENTIVKLGQQRSMYMDALQWLEDTENDAQAEGNG